MFILEVNKNQDEIKSYTILILKIVCENFQQIRAILVDVFSSLFEIFFRSTPNLLEITFTLHCFPAAK